MTDYEKVAMGLCINDELHYHTDSLCEYCKPIFYALKKAEKRGYHKGGEHMDDYWSGVVSGYKSLLESHERGTCYKQGLLRGATIAEKFKVPREYALTEPVEDFKAMKELTEITGRGIAEAIRKEANNEL